MEEIILDKLGKWTIEGSIIVLIILLLRFILKNKVKRLFIYYLWLPLIIRILIPITVESNFSIFNIFKSGSISYEDSYVSNNEINFNKNEINLEGYEDLYSNYYEETIALDRYENTEENYLETPSKDEIIKEVNDINLNKLISWTWLIIFIGLILKTVIGHYLFLRKLKRDSNLLEIPLEIKSIFNKLNINREVKIKETSLVNSPMLISQISPTILIPRKMKDSISNKELELIILHETSHYKRLDLIIIWLFKFVTIINFYNPLILYGYKLMRQDCEEACDEYVLSQIEDKEKIIYGNTIIKVIENISFNNSSIMGTTMALNKKEIKNRIINIKNNKSFRKRNIIIGVLILALVYMIILPNKINDNYLKLNLNNVSMIEFVKVEEEKSLYKTIYTGENLESILKLIEKLKLEDEAVGYKHNDGILINIYGDEEYSLKFVNETVELNNKLYAGDIDVINKLKNLYEKLDYEEKVYFSKNLSSYSKEVNNILTNMGYKAIMENGIKYSVLLPKIDESLKAEDVVSKAFEKIVLKSKENEALTKEKLEDYRGENLELIMYDATNINNPKDWIALAVFVKDEKIISYYLSDFTLLSSSYNDERFLIID